MANRCRECNDISAELLSHTELNEDAATGAMVTRNADGLHQDELKEIASLVREIDHAINRSYLSQATELTHTAKWRFDRKIEIMFA